MLPFPRMLQYGNTVLNIPKYEYTFSNNTTVSSGLLSGTVSGGSYISVPVSGYSTGIGGATLTFPSALPISTGDYYLEAEYYNNNNTVGYSIIATFNQNTGLRYGDSGYGNRIQYAADAGNQTLQYAIPDTRFSTYQQVFKLRWERKSGISKFYVNGVQTNFAVGTSTSYSNTQIVDTINYTTLTSLNLGSTGMALINVKLNF
ncbi:hypothetical protein XbC2_588 [Xanthomonas phage XbC2]|nr:hypothetical protein XbC2_588 [Xanthomonas phage XbC2]